MQSWVALEVVVEVEVQKRNNNGQEIFGITQQPGQFTYDSSSNTTSSAWQSIGIMTIL